MTDTTCPSCGAGVPGGAAFCTTCGTRLDAATPPPPPAAPDATVVDGTGVADPTLVSSPPPPAPAAPASAPWAPPEGAGAPPAAPAAPSGWPASPPAAPPAPAAPAPPGSWAPPTAPPGAAAPAAPWGGAPTAPGAPWDAPAAPPAASGPARSPLGGVAAIVGGVLTIAGVFSGWVTLGPTGNTVTDSAWSLTSGDGFLKSSDPYLLVGLGAVAVVLGLLLFVGAMRPIVRILAIVVGIGIVATAALNWASIASFVTDNFASDFKAKTAIGFYLVIAGGIVTAVAGLLPAKKS